MERSPSATTKILLLTSLYLSQGLPFGFFTQALPALLREEGYSLEFIGLTSLVALPWGLKFLWAPLVDRLGGGRFGPRRSWILPLQGLLALLLLAVGQMALASGLELLVAVVVVVNFISATQDIATDGLAIDMLAPAERGWANGVQVAGYRLGMIIGGGALLIYHDVLGWSGTFNIMAALIALASIPVIFHREGPKKKQDPGPSAAELAKRKASLLSFFKRSKVWHIVALITLYKAGDYFGKTMLKPYLIDSGLSLADVGWLLGTVGFVAGLLGALIGGGLVNRLGRRQALVAFAGFQALTVAGYALLANSTFHYEMAALLCAAEHLASGMATAALFTCMMDWTRPHAAATDYTVQASLVVLANGIASAVSGYSAGALGYGLHFILATLFSLLTVFAVWRLYSPDLSEGISVDIEGGLPS